MPTESVSRDGVWERLHLVRSDALERRLSQEEAKRLLAKFKYSA